MTDNLIDQVRELSVGAQSESKWDQSIARLQLEQLAPDMARHILATEERLKIADEWTERLVDQKTALDGDLSQLEERLRAAEALAELAKRHRHMTNCAFAAGTEEREGGSVNRQGKCIDQYEAWHKQMEDALAAFKATEAGE
jgi:hypothetical protein